MQKFVYEYPTKVYFGEGAAKEHLAEAVSAYGQNVMLAYGGGDLLDEKLSPAGKALTVNQCLHYALTRPAVATVLAGALYVLQPLCALPEEDRRGICNTVFESGESTGKRAGDCERTL